MFTIQEWGASRPEVVAGALAAEAARWRSDFAWDVSDAWRAIDPARAAGTLPGFVATDYSGRVVGWTCFLMHHGALQVAVFTAHSADVTDALVDAILSTPDASEAALHAVCVRDAAPTLRQALGRHGFETVTYRYLSTGSSTSRPDAAEACDPDRRASNARCWGLDDLRPLVRLFTRAYADTGPLRAFAPLGTDSEWFDYVVGLISGPGCGRLVPTASLVIDGSEPGRLDGALIATDLGCGTAHIAQVAIDPEAQGRGLGTALVRRAVGLFAAEGFDRVTLLVSSANVPAVRLYRGLGFRNRGSFVVAVNRQPRRFSNVALATGGVSTRL